MPSMNISSSMYTASSSSGTDGRISWQSNLDTPHRREIIRRIAELLKKSSSVSSPESRDRLRRIAKQIEFALYRSASSLGEYMDVGTLEQRLQQIAADFLRKSRTLGGEEHVPQRPDSQQQQPPNEIPAGSTTPMNSGRSGMASMGETAPFLTSGGEGSDPHNLLSRDEQRMIPTTPQQSLPQQQPPPQQYASPPLSTSLENRNDPQKLKVRHTQQQRLLLLIHSAKCKQEGNCQVTRHCADMKRLWRHMGTCKVDRCPVPHCSSSRFILDHFRNCKDRDCPTCGPIRATIRKWRGSSPPSIGPTRIPAAVQQEQRPLPQHQRNPPSQLQDTKSRTDGTACVGTALSVLSRSCTPPPDTGPTVNNYCVGQQYPSSFHSPSSSSDGSGSTSGTRLGLGQQEESKGRVPIPSRISAQAERVILLRHASRCPCDAGTCTVTPLCARMKRLWKHLSRCRNQQCKVQHCLSSRYVLSHFKKCKNPRCPPCRVARDFIQRDREESRKQRNSSQRQEQQRVAAESLDAAGSSDSMGAVPRISSSSSPPKRPRQESSHSHHLPDKRPKHLSDAALGGDGTQPTPMSNQNTVAPLKPVQGMAAGLDPNAEKEDSRSLLNTFAATRPETQLASREDCMPQLPPAQLKSKCIEILTTLQTHQYGWVFNCPVDPVELELPDYFDIIKKPMDLGTVQKKLESGSYCDFKEFAADVNLTFDNAIEYNAEGSDVNGIARELKTKFEVDWKELAARLEQETPEQSQGRASKVSESSGSSESS